MGELGCLNRGDLTTELGEELAILPPPQKAPRGRPAVDHRRILNDILGILHTEAAWRDLPERYDAWQAVASRFYPWPKRGLWERIFAGLQQHADEAGLIDWEVHSGNSTTMRAHQHAAGARGVTRKTKR